MLIRGLSAERGGTPVLRELGMTVPPGEITVLLGPSESGKTTLVRAICGLLRPQRGVIRIGGDDVVAATETELLEIRRGIAVMMGGPTVFDPATFGSLSVLDNLAYALGKRGVDPFDATLRAMERLRELDLAGVAELLPHQLPAYARKRLALARALVLDAPLTILDELDAGLDPPHRAQVLSAVERMHLRTGGTVLITAHDVVFARTLGHRVAILYGGYVVAEGDPDVLLRGIDTNEQFEARYLNYDHPHTPVPRGTDRDNDRSISFDPQLLLFAMAALIIISALLLVLGIGGDLPF